ncbi:MAG: efflux RND transporter periplasmic adaptor subunit [Rhodobacteraceae bacterium]|nr:efflux RND transporter periplasmic adaptor subunit [Paracoccaceae bacterium]
MTRFALALVASCLAAPVMGQHAISCLLEPARSITLAAPVPGILEEIAVARGDRVEAGQMVARIDSTVERATLAAAEFRAASTASVDVAQARLNEARRLLAQVQPLAQRGVASQNQLSELAAEVLIAESLLAEARDVQEAARLDVLSALAALELRVIRAPTAGVVLVQDPDVGEYADPDLPLALIVSVDRLKAEILMPSEAYRAVTIAAPVTILDAEGTQAAPGRILAKDAIIDAASRTFGLSVEIDNADGAFIAGTTCQIRFDNDGG